jgi:hypothetical protein
MTFKFCYTVYINCNVNTFVNSLITISYMHCNLIKLHVCCNSNIYDIF